MKSHVGSRHVNMGNRDKVAVVPEKHLAVDDVTTGLVVTVVSVDVHVNMGNADKVTVMSKKVVVIVDKCVTDGTNHSTLVIPSTKVGASSES